jgi:hypothetical protein
MRRELLRRLGLLLPAAFMSQASCGDQASAPCPRSCPAPQAGIALSVTSATDGGAPDSVGATLTGSTTVRMSCEPRGTASICFWGSGPMMAGSYALQVTASGFQTMNVGASITVTSDPRCGCGWATIEPSAVSLDPS